MYQYVDEHAYLERESLDKGNRVREELLTQDLTTEEFESLLNLRLDFVYARLPMEFWEEAAPVGVSRALLKEVDEYVKYHRRAYKRGLGLTLLGSNFSGKLSALYYLCRGLVLQRFKCFTVTYSQLTFFLRECKDNAMLKFELSDRLNADFFFLLGVPESDELPIFVKQDLFACLELRLSSERPTFFSAETRCSSLNDLLPDSLLGRILVPFTRVNKLIVANDSVDLDLLHRERWDGMIDGTD